MFKIKLVELVSGNPFKAFPSLRTIWEARLNRQAERNTAKYLKNGERGVYLILDAENNVIGLTGLFKLEKGSGRLGLRWHGLVPEARGKDYSNLVLNELCQIAKILYPKKKYLVEYVPIETVNGLRIEKYFKSNGFEELEAPRDVETFEERMSFPKGTGLILTLGRLI